MSILKKTSKALLYVILWAIIIGTLIKLVQGWPSLEQWKTIVSGDRLWAIPIVFISFLVATILRALRWGLFLRENIEFKWADIIVQFTWFFFLATFSPFRAGELARPLWVRKQGGSASMAMASLMIERLTDVLVLLLCVGVVSMFSPNVPAWVTEAGSFYLLLIIVAYIFISIFALPLKNIVKTYTVKIKSEENSAKKQRLSMRLIKLTEGFAYLSDVRTNIPMILITMLIWLTVAAGFYVFLYAFFPGIHWTAAFAVMAAVNLSSLVAIAPGNLGVYELVAVVTLTVFSITSADALVASVGLHTVILISTLVCGLLAKLKLQHDGQRLVDLI